MIQKHDVAILARCLFLLPHFLPLTVLSSDGNQYCREVKKPVIVEMKNMNRTQLDVVDTKIIQIVI